MPSDPEKCCDPKLYETDCLCALRCKCVCDGCYCSINWMFEPDYNTVPIQVSKSEDVAENG